MNIKRVYKKYFIYIFSLGLVLAQANSLQAKNIIDLTHILAKEIKLPKVQRTRMRPVADRSLSFADTYNETSEEVVKTAGTTEKFWTRNIATGKFEQITAILRYVGKHAYIYVQDTQDVDIDSIKNVAKQFDEIIYPTNTSYFGLEWSPGIDRDRRISLLMCDIQDGYADPDDPYAAGYFFAGDEMYQKDFPTHSKTKSNEREILYLDTYPCNPDDEDYMEIVAHEFQHMIHYNQDKEEETWVNEGCSQIAPVLCGFAPPGHYKLLKDKADRSLNYWATWDPLPDYGQVYIWNEFILNRVLTDESSKKQFFQTLTSCENDSIAGYIEAFKNTSTNFSDAFTAFSITNHINDPMLEGGRYSYSQPKLANFRLPPIEEINAFPTKLHDSVNVWSSDSIYADLSTLKEKLTVSFSGYKRFLGPTYPYFKVAAIQQDSSKQKLPKINFMKMSENPKDKNRLIGKVEILPNQGYDNLTIVIMAMAPEKYDDTDYTPASAFIYDVFFTPEKLPEANMLVRARNSSINFDKFVKDLLSSYENPDIESAIALQSQLANMLLKTVKNEVEEQNFTTVDSFIKAAKGESSKVLKPFAREIATILRFELQQNPNTDSKAIQLRIEKLLAI